MEFKIKGQEKELNFGVRFAAQLDASDTYKAQGAEGIEFGMGILLSEEKLGMGSIEMLAKVIHSALHQHNVTIDEVYDSLDVYIENDEAEELFDKIDVELKNSKAVRLVKARMNKKNKEANRTKGVQAVKPTK